MDYSKYHDKHIRNDPKNKDEEALADYLAEEEVRKFLDRFDDEPSFSKRIGNKLIVRLA